MQCPRCDYPLMKRWKELDDDEKFLFERLPPPANLSLEERKSRRFCPRCRFEQPEANSIVC